MAYLAITTNINDTVIAALHEVDPSISVSTSGLVYGTATGNIETTYEHRAIIVRPTVGDPYIIDFKHTYVPDIHPTYAGPYAVFPLREVVAVTAEPRVVALRAAREVLR